MTASANLNLKQYLPVTLFFLVIFCLFTTPIQDGDFFWHIKNGQWIWEHRALPQSDPFSYTTPPVAPASPLAERVDFTLKQYWLGQLALYGLWQMAGEAGIVYFRAAAFSGILLLLFSWMRKHSRGVIPLLFVFLTGNLLRNYPSERPQIFTFIFMPLVLYLLEKIRQKEGSSTVNHALLALIMLVWANCHGGFILGIIMICIYVAGNVFEAATKRSPFDWRGNLLLIFAAAIAAFNPCGLQAFKAATAASPLAATNQEYLSPIQAALKLRFYLPEYWAFIIVVVGTIAIKCRAMKPVHCLVLVFMGLLSLTGLRYLPFPLMASPLLIPYLREREWPYKWGVATAVLLLWAALADWGQSFSPVADRLFPEKAARFISSTKPAGELFNYYDWGGYFMFHLPDRRVFIDGRVLDEGTTLTYEKALWAPQWKEILDRFRVNTVAIPGVSKSTGAIYPLAVNLLGDKDWYLVYRDDVSLVFVRNMAANREIIARYAVPKEEIYRHALQMLKLLPKEVSANLDYWLSLGDASYFVGDFKGASAAYKVALAREPGNQWAQRMLIQVGR